MRKKFGGGKPVLHELDCNSRPRDHQPLCGKMDWARGDRFAINPDEADCAECVDIGENNRQLNYFEDWAYGGSSF